MTLLTTQKIEEQELIQTALQNEGIKADQVKPLGEGAWHKAYLIEKEQLVLRIPKAIAYDKKVDFDERELRAEYEGTEVFYDQANRAKPGICPGFFRYSVTPELTYTIESFMGTTVGLAGQSLEEARQFGRELGECYRGLEQLDTSLKGIGYLQYDEGLRGSYEMDAQEFLTQETEEYREELHTLFQNPAIRAQGEELLATRSIENETIILTNQDTSPENILFTKKGPKMIDPFPLLATGTSLAANHVFNYTELFPKFSNTERYRKGNYYIHAAKLRANAEGFAEAYVDGSFVKKEALRVEVFIKLLTMAHDHHQLLQGSMEREDVIRFGARDQIEARLAYFLEKVKEGLRC
ncbi:hypothetical protein LCM20_08480 [Halobacillus litoralis]|uniref:hypothetical protein n=1 Tax=Halobacillus litoralis TaxID=45668 RepID=UPI001CD786F7|nr:hypothetical protein [Halobacillus litoralis]MCA0970620.1 hypothetical protein [Halobacillus litoralis]